MERRNARAGEAGSVGGLDEEAFVSGQRVVEPVHGPAVDSTEPSGRLRGQLGADGDQGSVDFVVGGARFQVGRERASVTEVEVERIRADAWRRHRVDRWHTASAAPRTFWDMA